MSDLIHTGLWMSAGLFVALVAAVVALEMWR